MPDSLVAPAYHGRCIDGRVMRRAVELAPVPASVSVARDHAREWLQSWGYAQTDDAALVVSELVTNALQATARLRRRRPVHLAVSTGCGWILVIVADASLQPPVLRDPGPDGISGRGLAVVEALSDRWGWHRVNCRGVAKAIWAEFKDIHPPQTPNVSLANAVSRGGGEPIGGM